MNSPYEVCRHMSAYPYHYSINSAPEPFINLANAFVSAHFLHFNRLIFSGAYNLDPATLPNVPEVKNSIIFHIPSLVVDVFGGTIRFVAQPAKWLYLTNANSISIILPLLITPGPPEQATFQVGRARRANEMLESHPSESASLRPPEEVFQAFVTPQYHELEAVRFISEGNEPDVYTAIEYTGQTDATDTDSIL